MNREERTTNSFWTRKSLDQLAGEQGIRPVEDLTSLVGAGADLWDDDEDFEAFLIAIGRWQGR